MRPISPHEVQEAKNNLIPSEVIAVFNELIASHWNGQSSTIYQRDVLKKVREVTAATSQHIFDNKWLDVESIFREAGWKVFYDKPAYCEDYEPHWVFKK